MTFKPMLSGKADLSSLRFPLLVSPKLDGIRVLAMNGVAMSRTLKPIPNAFVQAWFQKHAYALEGLDGEIIVGSSTAPDVYRQTNSGVMSEKLEPDFTFWVFDKWSTPNVAYEHRLHEIIAEPNIVPRAKALAHALVHTLAQLDAYEIASLEAGYEGVMLRDPKAFYKHGRSSTKEGYLLKLKRFQDAEAEVTGFEEFMHNGNVATKDNFGRTARSSHKDNQVPMGMLGALICQGVTAFPGVEFRIGTGFDAATRQIIWRNRQNYIRKIVKFKYFDIGVKDAPRHPVYLGMRDEIDVVLA